MTTSERRHTAGLIAGIPKDYRPYVRNAVRQGWTFKQIAKGHPILTNPDGTFSTPIPKTSTSTSLFKHITSKLRKHGVEAT